MLSLLETELFDLKKYHLHELKVFGNNDFHKYHPIISYYKYHIIFLSKSNVWDYVYVCEPLCMCTSIQALQLCE